MFVEAFISEKALIPVYFMIDKPRPRPHPSPTSRLHFVVTSLIASSSDTQAKEANDVNDISERSLV